ncbi:MAG: hypothetical protein ACON44_06625 [Candidatus Puniceispirillaceae bacterium]
MGIVIALFGFIAIGESDSAQQFAKHSNGIASYEIVRPRKCPSGLRETGYSWSVAGGVVLKQENTDGTIGPVCSDE